MGSAVAARTTEGKLAIRVMAGTAAAFALYVLLNQPQGYWAVFTVIIVMQGSIGGTVSVAVERMYGTLVGAVVGGLAAAVRAQTPEGLGVALILSVGLTSLFAAIRPNLKVAPVTSAIMLMSHSGGLPPLEAASFRVFEIAVGSITGVLATVLIFPAPSREAARSRAVEALDAIAAMLDRCAEALQAGGGEGLRLALQPDHDRLRALVASVEQAQKEADQERSARLAAQGDPPAVLRGLWRARNAVTLIGRACGDAQPEAVKAHIAEAGAALIRAEAERARACGAALGSGGRVDRGDLGAVDAAFLTAVDSLRRAQWAQALSFDDIGHVLGLAFAAEGLRRDLDDLADRIDEIAGAVSRRPRRFSPITRA
ncbi:hypothetical protein BH09PSE2_BH09PSE2_19340 [soil metagenome]